MKFITVFSVLATLATAVSVSAVPGPQPELLKTNAARFAQGLAPLPPRYLRRNIGSPVNHGT